MLPFSWIGELWIGELRKFLDGGRFSASLDAE